MGSDYKSKIAKYAGTIDARVGSKIIQLRKKLGYTRFDLAVACGMSKSHLQSIENGVQSIKVSTLYTIAKELGVPIQDLIP